MHKFHVIRAWKWLLVRLLIAASAGYLSTLLLVGLKLASPAAVLRTTTSGLRHVGRPILTQGVAIGIDRGVMIFFCNLAVAMLIVALVYWVQLLNPYNQEPSFLRFRRHLQRDRSAEHLRKIPLFAEIQSSQLRLTSFLLLVAPLIATVVLGFMAGILLGSVHLLSSSPLVALAYILPHGVPEVTALLLACSLPVGIWTVIRPVVDNEQPAVAFRRIERAVASQQFQRSLKIIVTLLMIAGVTEAHLTLRVVALFSGG